MASNQTLWVIIILAVILFIWWYCSQKEGYKGHCYHPPCDLKCKPGYQLRGRTGRGRCYTGGCQPDEKRNLDCLCCSSETENLHLSENECQKCMKGCDGYPSGSAPYWECWNECQRVCGGV